MKEEYEWTLVNDKAELIGTGAVLAENAPNAYREAFKQLDPDRQTAVLKEEIQLNIHERGQKDDS